MKHYIAFTFSLFAISFSINGGSLQEKYTEQHTESDTLDAIYLELGNATYRKEILPHDFSHLISLIEAGVNTNQPPAYARSVIKLFSNLLKGADYVDAREFSNFLTQLPGIMPHYLSLSLATRYVTNAALLDAYIFDRFHATVNDMLYFKFSSDYDSFKKNPTLFLSHVSTDIMNVAQEEFACEQVRQALINFFEIALNKLMWNPQEQEQTWMLTKKISEDLATLLEHNILDDTNDLDDLYWTLLHRYCYIITDLSATDMNQSFYEIVKNDILSEPSLLFELEEQDSIIESKHHYVIHELARAEVECNTYHST